MLALIGEVGRAKELLASGEWRPSDADADVAAQILARLTASRPTDADRRFQRIWRTTVHHLDEHAVSPPATALLAAVARAFLPWYASPNPPTIAAAPRYPAPPGGPTEVGEALLPSLISVFADLAAGRPAGTEALTPPVVPWEVQYMGRFRHYGRSAPSVWTADTFRCSGCARADGPWTVTSDWRRVTLACSCGTVTLDHGLTFSEVWLLLPALSPGQL